MIKLAHEKYCENCKDYSPVTDTSYLGSDDGIEVCYTQVECKYAQRCKCIADHIKASMKETCD